MANYLKTDAVSIECELEQYLQPNQLNTVKGRSVLDTVAARYPRPFMVQIYGELCPFYIAPRLDVLVGYEAGHGPSLNPALLGKLMGMSNCLVQVDLFNKHFANPAAVDYNGSFTLRLPSGDTTDLIFSSQVMQYFSASSRFIITLFAPALAGLSPVLTAIEQKLLAGNEHEELFKKLQSLDPLRLSTFSCIGEGKGDKAIMEVIKKERPTLSGYVRDLKDLFGVNTRYELMLISRKLAPR
jgi:hypothetical protein